ncbi:hypothetical protein PACTADRAFT_74961 [Pachysolen tannophilus NRRL Y-2460]|uniref:Cytochrome b2, mitochondrial n=1 Tax=Pachysolen tannophilus NRRL Y-2460 TaxID=669874 RepID=A0A1E4U0E8_PACTA|nr:hypothetical protein PACTADRAFT_74961 [Pachysolen tannophilus NRRL Y-2460]
MLRLILNASGAKSLGKSKVSKFLEIGFQGSRNTMRKYHSDSNYNLRLISENKSKYSRILYYFAAAAINVSELVKHNTKDNLWVAVNGKVYDLTEFAQKHPGGSAAILEFAGRDASNAFNQIHRKDLIPFVLAEEKFLGHLVGKLPEEEVELSEEEILRLKNIRNKPPLHKIFSITDMEYVAKHVLPKSTYNYFATGSEDEFTLREGHYAYSRVYFRPRILCDVREVDLSTTMLGTKVAIPIYFSATGGQGRAHPEAEKIITRVAKKHGMVQMIPFLSKWPVEEIVAEADPNQDQWFQLHFNSLETFKKAPEIIKKINSLPNIKALMLNVDCPCSPIREKDIRTRAEATGADVEQLASISDPNNVYATLTWEDIANFRKMTDLPIVLKGVQRTEDVLKAAELGYNGVILSNTGGRALDFSQPTLEVLAETMPELRKQPYYNKDKFQVYIDGGIRRSTDVVKALCLGATGVGIGRPFLYSMSSYGEDGVNKLIEILKVGLSKDMKLLGAKNVDELDESFLNLKDLYNRGKAQDKLYDALYDSLPFPKFEEDT